jgi:hypothetical protein
MKIIQLYEAKALDEIPVCPQERLVIISNTTGLSFALERIGLLTAIITIIFYLLALYLSTISSTSKNPFASICSDSLIKTACQHLLLLVGFDTLIYRKYYDTPPILLGHHYACLLLAMLAACCLLYFPLAACYACLLLPMDIGIASSCCLLCSICLCVLGL